MLVEETDARPEANESTIDATDRGPFRLDQFNLYRFWFSVRNVFFPMKTQLADWKIELVDTQLWQISCNRKNRRIEIANRVFRDRNDLRTTLILATILTQPNRNDAKALKTDTIRVAQMAAFIKHTELSAAIRRMHNQLDQTELEHIVDGKTDLIHCQRPDETQGTVEASQSAGDLLFDDTLAANGINDLLRQENLLRSASQLKIKKSSNAA